MWNADLNPVSFLITSARAKVNNEENKLEARNPHSEFRSLTEAVVFLEFAENRIQ